MVYRPNSRLRHAYYSHHRVGWFSRLRRSTKRSVLLVLAFIIAFGSVLGWQWFHPSESNKAHAATSYSFTPTGGEVVTGTEQTVTAQTAASNEGVNVGSWRATTAQDNFHWQVAGAASAGTNFDVQLSLDGVVLNNANQILITTTFDLDATAPNLKIQICDWVSTTSVDNAADSKCTGGGWRTLNSRNESNTPVAITGVSPITGLQFQIYNGYWSTGTTGGSAISTPLSNFITSDSNKRIKIRYFDDSVNTSSVLSIDFLKAQPFIDSFYQPASFTNLGSGTPAGTYANALVLSNTAAGANSGTDTLFLHVPGTAGSIADFYLSYKDVRTTSSMNTFVVKSVYRCSAAGINIRPKIYNFNSSSWEDLTTASIACATGASTNEWAKNNVTVSNYISGGEVRIGWYGLSNAATEIKIDSMYMMIGSTNTDSASCEFTIGTGTATDCTKTRDLDTTGTTNSFSIASADETTNMGTGEASSYYPGDFTTHSTANEAAAANMSIPMNVPSNAQVVGLDYAWDLQGRTAGSTGAARVALKEMAGGLYTTNSWFQIGTTSNASMIYSDSVSQTSVTSNPLTYIDTIAGTIRIRVYTATNPVTADNSSINWDFAFVSLQWIEDSSHPSRSYQFTATGENLVTGTDQPVDAATAASAEGVNVGSWKGTLDADNFHWVVAGAGSAGTNFNVQLNADDVGLNGANKLIIRTKYDLDVTIPNIKVQICDWVSTTSVDNAADAQCTGGGWRTLNSRDATNTPQTTTSTSAVSLQWQIYDGYFSTGTTGGTPIATPLANFVKNDSTHRVKVRYFDNTVNTNSTLALDYFSIEPVIDSVYEPANLTNLGSGTPTGNYINANPITHTTASTAMPYNDVIYVGVPGTAGSAADFYFSFNNVKTYTGMNTISVNARYKCSAASGTNHRPKIYNFNSSSWEDLTTASIACSTTAAIAEWAKNNVTISNYISNGEIRIGDRMLANSTTRIDYDWIYANLGTTNSDSSNCEISFGTGTATDCTNTRDLDTTGTTNTFNATAADESTNMGTAPTGAYYPFDIDMDSTASEEGNAEHVGFSVTLPANAAIAGVNYAYRFTGLTSGSQGRAIIGYRDYSGNVSTQGGYVQVGSNFGTVQYDDALSTGSIQLYGIQSNPQAYLDGTNNLMKARLRTNIDPVSTDNNQHQWDFAMMSLQWVETAPTYAQAAYRIYANADSVTPGSGSAAQDTAFTLAASGDAFRVRLLINVSNSELLLSGQNFKLQYVGKGSGTCATPSGGTPSSYTDVTTGTTIAYKDNATPADGANLTSSSSGLADGSKTIEIETYEELNNFTNSQYNIYYNEDGEWDFSLKDNGTTAATYCLRVVQSDGTVLGTYTSYPTITTSTNTPTTDQQLRHGTWFNNGVKQPFSL